MKSTAINMVSVLGTITLVSALAVSGFYLLTKDAIELANQNKLNSAISEVVPGFDNAPSSECFLSQAASGDSLLVYPAKKGEELIGYAVKTYSMNGYGGEIDLMVGVKVDGTINAVTVLSEAETPGLGHKMSTEDVLTSQFRGVDPSKMKIAVKKAGGDVDAITAATISSKAFCDAVNRALSVTDPLLKKSSATDAASGATSVKK